MEAIKSLLVFMTPNCCMTKLYIKDIYSYTYLLPEHQKQLKLYFRGKLCQFTCLSNGLCSGPRKFTKLLEPPLYYLRLLQVIIVGFIDDLITQSRCFAERESNIKLIVALLNSLDLWFTQINQYLSQLKFIIFKIFVLGFITDAQLITLSLTLKKRSL